MLSFQKSVLIKLDSLLFSENVEYWIHSIVTWFVTFVTWRAFLVGYWWSLFHCFYSARAAVGVTLKIIWRHWVILPEVKIKENLSNSGFFFWTIFRQFNSTGVAGFWVFFGILAWVFSRFCLSFEFFHEFLGIFQNSAGIFKFLKIFDDKKAVFRSTFKFSPWKWSFHSVLSPSQLNWSCQFF